MQDEQIVSIEPQPVTQSCAVEVQNTDFQARNRTQPDKDPPVIELDTGEQSVQDDVEGIIEPLNKTKIEDNQEPAITPISELGQSNADLMTHKRVKKLKSVLTKASGIEEARKAGKESVEKIVKNIEAQSTKVSRQPNKATTQQPKGDKGKTPKKEKVLTRRQEAERKRIENQKRPKKDQIELPPRKIAFEIVEVSDDEAPLGVPGHHGAHASGQNKTKTETVAKVVKQGAHKPKAPPPSKPQTKTQKPTEKRKNGPEKYATDTPPRVKPSLNSDTHERESPQKVILPNAKEREKNIISLGPRTKENAEAYDNTKKNLKKLISHQKSQIAYAKGRNNGGGPDRNSHRMAERLNQHNDVVILPNGGPGFVRNMNIPFKPRHGEAHMTKEQIEKKRQKEKEREESGNPIYVPQGQMVKHTRNQKKRFLRREERKYIRGHGFGLRLAKARELLITESIPKIRPSVFIKAKEGHPAYMRDDPRLKRAINAFKHKIRAQIPMNENLNEHFGPYPKRPAEDITLVQINSDRSDEEVDQEPTPTVPLEVSLSNFIVRPQLQGN